VLAGSLGDAAMPCSFRQVGQLAERKSNHQKNLSLRITKSAFIGFGQSLWWHQDIKENGHGDHTAYWWNRR